MVLPLVAMEMDELDCKEISLLVSYNHNVLVLGPDLPGWPETNIVLCIMYVLRSLDYQSLYHYSGLQYWC